MGTIVLLHGTGGSPESNWLPWLKKQLTSWGKEVIIPKFPTPEGQSLGSWLAAFDEQVGELSGDMMLVGHSMGCGFIGRLLERSGVSVRASFFVSGWTGLLDLPDFDPLIESFFSEPFDWPTIRKNAGQIYCYHGDSDPYVPLAMGKEFAKNLAVEVRVFKDGGHLNAEAGFLEFPELLSDIAAV